ncbi:MAG TPA: hypothetical protein VFR11_14565 [Micromonosporaceae bacterium]|jgi:hypothetical protein|nr:hypothetical protein [Micromonosporaceae bacterium]
MSELAPTGERPRLDLSGRGRYLMRRGRYVLGRAGALLQRGVGIRIDRVTAVVEQATLGPVLVRFGSVLAALGGFAVTWPTRDLTTTSLVVPILFALGVGIAPRSLMPTATIVAIVLGYMFNLDTGAPLTVWRPIAAASMIYIVHTSAAFAAVLPFNAVATRGLFLPYVLRIAAVIAITAILAVGILAVPGIVGQHRLVSAAVAGMVAMVGVAGYVAYLGSQRR